MGCVCSNSNHCHHTNTSKRKKMTNDTSTSQLSIINNGAQENKSVKQLDIEQLETGEKTSVKLAEHDGKECPRHTVGCTPYECHGSLMEKNGFGSVSNDYAPGTNTTLEEAVAFLTQYAHEEESAYGDVKGGLAARLREVKDEVERTGTYVQTFKEIEYGCRLAWRNSGRCIMRKVGYILCTDHVNIIVLHHICSLTTKSLYDIVLLWMYIFI